MCRHGWFDSKGGFLYSGSSSGRAAVSKTAGCRFEPCLECQTLHDRGWHAEVAGHLAAKVPDAAATSYCPVKTDYGVAAYMPS